MIVSMIIHGIIAKGLEHKLSTTEHTPQGTIDTKINIKFSIDSNLPNITAILLFLHNNKINGDKLIKIKNISKISI